MRSPPGRSGGPYYDTSARPSLRARRSRCFSRVTSFESRLSHACTSTHTRGLNHRLLLRVLLDVLNSLGPAAERLLRERCSHERVEVAVKHGGGGRRGDA